MLGARVRLTAVPVTAPSIYSTTRRKRYRAAAGAASGAA